MGEVTRIEPAGACGGDRDRTGDLIVANDALSQLSYTPTAGRATATTAVGFFILTAAFVSRIPGLFAISAVTPSLFAPHIPV